VQTAKEVDAHRSQQTPKPRRRPLLPLALSGWTQGRHRPALLLLTDSLSGKASPEEPGWCIRCRPVTRTAPCRHFQKPSLHLYSGGRTRSFCGSGPSPSGDSFCSFGLSSEFSSFTFSDRYKNPSLVLEYYPQAVHRSVLKCKYRILGTITLSVVRTGVDCKKNWKRMPRTSKVESPGCPPLRVLTSDLLGLIKVVECHAKNGTPKVVETWGSPDASQGVVAASFADDKTNPLLAVGRKNGSVELLNPLNGDVLKSYPVHEGSLAEEIGKSDPIVGLHLFNRKQSESLSRLSMLLMCTENGKACLRSFTLGDMLEGSSSVDSLNVWSICSTGKLLCSSFGGKWNHALFAGKGIEVNVWDLEKCQRIWTAKPPPRNSLGIFIPTWFTATTFLSKEDHRKIVAGTNDHQVRLYDVAAQRRPVISVDFRESSIKAVTEDVDGYTVYVGTGSGDLASFDMRTGKLLGCFIGKCCGSIRSIVRHPELPVIASCGLDSYLRIWDTKTRQPLSAVFLKQHLTNAVIDSHFSDEVRPVDKQFEGSELHNPEEDQGDDEPLFGRRKPLKEKKQSKKAKTKRNDVKNGNKIDKNIEENNELSRSKRIDPTSETSEDGRKKRSKKRRKAVHADD
ncbi:hypothetical protein Taro_031183, partial [Colocasia esculenta]|nr:hypothetical protein [Colocasia esculenta]